MFQFIFECLNFPCENAKLQIPRNNTVISGTPNFTEKIKSVTRIVLYAEIPK